MSSRFATCRAGAKPRSLQLLPNNGSQASVAFKLINTVVNRATSVDSDMSTTFVPGKACMRLALHARFDQRTDNRFFNAYSYFVLDLGFVCFARMSLVMQHYC